MSTVRRLGQYLGAPVDAAGLRAFRVSFGLVAAAAALRFIAKGWVDSQYVAPAYHFAYPGFGFVRAWPGAGMHVHFALLALAGLGLAAGRHARACACALALGWTYVELIDRAYFLNHYYLACSLAWLLALTLPNTCRWQRQAPRWVLFALRAQVACVYVFAGLAKLNADWLLRAQPLRIWLAARSDVPVPWIGGLLASPESAFVASWAGALFDLAIVPLLVWRRTRAPACAFAFAFHVSTGWLLPIGMFPWIMLSALALWLDGRWIPQLTAAGEAGSARPQRWAAAACALYLGLQLIVPLHQQLCVRNGVWTSAGIDFAWRVMLAEKSGSVAFRTPAGPAPRLAPLTAQQAAALACDPRLIASYARELGARAHTPIYADAFCALNGRPAQRLIARQVDLAQPQLPSGWVLPLLQ